MTWSWRLEWRRRSRVPWSRPPRRLGGPSYWLLVRTPTSASRGRSTSRVDVEQREKECMDAITALSEQEKAGDNIDAQTERLRQDAEHTIQQRRRSNQSEETWDATIAAKLAAGLEPWTPRSDGILDFPHALYGTWLSVEVAADRLIGRRERLDDDKDLMLKALRKARGTDACATALFEAPATWLHPRASQVDSGFEVMGNDVEVLSLFASKLARFAKELFRLEHRCDVRGVAFGETDCVVDCRGQVVRETCRFEGGISGGAGLPGGGLRTSGFDRRGRAAGRAARGIKGRRHAGRGGGARVIGAGPLRGAEGRVVRREVDAGESAADARVRARRLRRAGRVGHPPAGAISGILLRCAWGPSRSR